MMRRLKPVHLTAFVSASLVALSPLAQVANAQAPATPPGSAIPAATGLELFWKNGTEAFSKGDFQTTITNFRSLIEQAPKDAQLESVYFTLGAAYFNVKDYKSSADTFAKLLATYPQSPRSLEVTFSMAQAEMLAGRGDVAANLFKKLEAVPQYKQQIPLLVANSLKQSLKFDEAIAVLEKMISGGIQSPAAAKGAMMLVDLYTSKNDVEKAAKVLVDLNNHISQLENVAALNSLAVTVGDKCLALKKNLAAVGCYRAVRSKEAVKEIQQQRIDAMERQITNNKALLEQDPTQIMRLRSVNEDLRKNIDDAKHLLEEFDKIPPIIPPLYLRIARAFYEDGKPWEALVVYSDLMKRFPNSAEMEPALYASLVTFAEINQPKRALALCDQYVKAFPKGPNIATVVYFQGNIALQNQDFSKAESYFGVILKDHANSPLAEQVRFLLGNSKFQQGSYKEAADEYAKYIKQFPKGNGVEEARYRLAVAILFGGSINDALPLISDYLSKYPNGQFTPDAKYRLMLCLFQNQDYDKVIESSKAWQKQYGNDQQLGEVLALEADAHAAKDETDAAVQTYIQSYKAAANDQVLNYSLFEASKLLQKRGNWDQIASMFEEFVKDRPEDPAVTTALFWIGKAKVKLGKVDEAKKFLADTVNKYIDDPGREAVEQIITQLAVLCTRRKPVEVPATSGSGAPVPPPTPTPTPADLGAELERLLVGGNSPTAKSRVLYAKAELARMRRQPEKEQQYLLEIADVCKPEDLSAVLLGVVGERLVANGRYDKALPFFAYLRSEYPKSDLVDYAYVGMGDIALQKKDYRKALDLYQEGIDSSPGGVKMRDLTVGKAKALLELNRFDDAKKLFQEIAAMREWRGEATAVAVFSLGEIERKTNHLPEAIAYYQRVFVGYQKFLPIVAKAYIQSADCFLKIGKNQEAINTYKELLRNEKLKLLPEADIARKAVEAAGAQL